MLLHYTSRHSESPIKIKSKRFNIVVLSIDRCKTARVLNKSKIQNLLYISSHHHIMGNSMGHTICRFLKSPICRYVWHQMDVASVADICRVDNCSMLPEPRCMLGPMAYGNYLIQFCRVLIVFRQGKKFVFNLSILSICLSLQSFSLCYQQG